LNYEPKGGIHMNHMTLAPGGIVIVRPAGELDHHTADSIKREVSRLIFGGKATGIIWDLGNLQFMDSAGIGLILGRMRDLGAVDGGTVILNPSPTMRKMFELSGLGSHLAEGTEEDAMKRLGGILHGK
jgi:stage II sporulation protein AA (anti-sigma F factor antagonist)